MVKTVTCELCGETVNKRQSIVVENYGRICRKHPQVEEYQAKLEAERKRVAEAKHSAVIERDIMRKLHIMAAVSCIRSMAYIRGLDLNLVAGLVIHRQPQDERAEIVKELNERGPMTDSEFMGGLLMHADMLSRAK
jgi:hypothetical protein